MAWNTHSTTRLAAVIHYLAGEYCWSIDHVDMEVGTNDGRVQQAVELMNMEGGAA